MTNEFRIPDGPGVIPVEKVRELKEGMREDEVLQVLGPPLLQQAPDACVGPTEVFRQLGFTMFEFTADSDLDVVWVYLHNRRGAFELTKRISTYVGFQNGRATGGWQVYA
jgi:hypothetical protein